MVKNDKENEQDENEETANNQISDKVNDENDDDYEQKFHFIITNSEYKVPLPKIIEIHDPYPGEPKWMRKGKHPAVLRQHKIRKEGDYES